MVQNVSAVGGGYSLYGQNNINYANDPFFMAAFQAPNINTQAYAQQAGAYPQVGVQQQIPTQTTEQVPTVPSAANQIAFEGKQSTATEPKKKNNAANWIVGLASVAGLIFCGYKCHGKGTGEGLSKIWDGAKQYWNKGINLVEEKLPKLKFKNNKNNPPQAILPAGNTEPTLLLPRHTESSINGKQLEFAFS